MKRSPGVRNLTLTAHVVSSIGWLGAVAGFLVLAVAGMTADDLTTVRAAYLAMELVGWFAVVPLALASLLTGVLQGLATHWGVFRHYWVVFKLLINVVATLLLLLYMQTLGSLARLAETAVAASDLDALRSPSPVLHAAGALLLLLTATTLAVYKPRGLTPYGVRRQRRA
ncbi:MAG: DUF2269 domain-containing protein [Thermoleophilia bacterium]|nr:DUF2269 domain-containing protein [Thermoleophilia bacterium]